MAQWHWAIPPFGWQGFKYCLEKKMDQEKLLIYLPSTLCSPKVNAFI